MLNATGAYSASFTASADSSLATRQLERMVYVYANTRLIVIIVIIKFL